MPLIPPHPNPHVTGSHPLMHAHGPSLVVQQLEGCFMLNGVEVALPVRDSDPLHTKVEALKAYLGQQLGADTFQRWAGRGVWGGVCV